MLEEFLCFLGSRTRVQWQWKHRVPCLKSDPVSQLDISTMPWRQDFKSRSLGIFLATMESCTSRWQCSTLIAPLTSMPVLLHMSVARFLHFLMCLELLADVFSNFLQPSPEYKDLNLPTPNVAYTTSHVKWFNRLCSKRGNTMSRFSLIFTRVW